MTAPRSKPLLILSFTVVLGLVAATVAWAHFKVEKTEPEADSTVSAPVRALRVWFTQEPDVAVSKLSLTGPKGELEVTGVHTMGEKDLMGRVVGSMPDGEYTASWQAAGDDGHVLKGEWKFTLDRGASSGNAP